MSLLCSQPSARPEHWCPGSRAAGTRVTGGSNAPTSVLRWGRGAAGRPGLSHGLARFGQGEWGPQHCTAGGGRSSKQAEAPVARGGGQAERAGTPIRTAGACRCRVGPLATCPCQGRLLALLLRLLRAGPLSRATSGRWASSPRRGSLGSWWSGCQAAHTFWLFHGNGWGSSAQQALQSV